MSESASSCSSGSPVRTSARSAARSVAGRSSAACKTASTFCQRSGVMLQSPVQPGFGRLPVTAHSHQRKSHCFGGLFQTQSAKVTKFDHARSAWTEQGKLRERFIETYELPGSLGSHSRSCFDGNVLRLTAVFDVMPPSRVIDQNVTHHLRGDREEV